MSPSRWLLATLALLGPIPLRAQTTGQIVGVVINRQDSTPVSGAEVLVAGTDVRTVTGRDGAFVLIGLPPGRHTLAARAIGYTTFELRGIQVRAGVSTRVTVAVSSATVLEPILVEVEARPLLTPDVTSTRQIVGREELATTPIESIEQVLELRTGISDGHFRGGRLGQETFVIDGIDVKNQFAASRDGAAFQLAPSAVQEIAVLTSGWSADQASAVSGVVNLVTRSGPTEGWFGRLELLSDDWAPDVLRRGYNRAGFSAGGPVGGGATAFVDVLLIGQGDQDPRAKGLICLEVEFPCPLEQAMIPHQEGDRYFVFGKLDVPLSAHLDAILSVSRNRDQHELYSTRFKYALPDYLAERQTASLLTATLRGNFQPRSSRALLATARIAAGRVDRFLGVLTDEQPARLGRFRWGDYRFRGEDFVTTDPEGQIASGRTVPDYREPSDSGLGSPYGIFGSDLFVTDGSSSVAEWSRSEFVNVQADLQTLVSPQHDLKIGADVKLYHIQSYQHVAAGLAGAAPNFVEFYPAVVAGYLHNTLHVAGAATIDIGVRVEAFQPRLESPTDRRDLTAPTATTAWRVMAHPRIGFAMPLSVVGVDRAALRWNFGRFAQPPDFQFFFDQALDDSLNTAIRRQGNPNLGFERGIQYEGALDYLIHENVVVRVTGFFKDLSGLTTSGITLGGVQEQTFTNLDFGRVQGAEVKLEARLPGERRLEVGYALQKAFGVVSTAFDSSASDTTSDIQELEVPLQFDRRHAIDVNALWPVAGFHVGVGTSIASGLPVPGAAERRLGWSANVSARLMRDWRLGGLLLRFTAEGRNLLGLDNLVSAREGGGVQPDVRELETRAAADTEGAVSIPRESPLYLSNFDVNADGFLSPSEQQPFHQTPMLDQLESGPWPSFVTGLKRLAHENNMMVDLLGQLEHSYKTRLGYWKGGTVSVFGYGGGIIPRFSEVAGMFPESKEFHTLRVQPPAGNHYTTKLLRQLSNSWSKWGSGLIAFHGQTGNIMFIGATTENTQHFFDEINQYGFDLGGAGPCVRTAMSCVGAARCEQSCANEHRIHRTLVNNFIDDMHRPALPYKFKFKVSGCPNDCMNSIQRADFAVIGTWRDDMQVDQKGVKEYVKGHGRKYTIDNVIARCPTKALSLNDDDTLEVDNKSCVRCMHCINVMTKALKPGKDRGITLLIGGKRTLKIGDTMGTVIVPFMKMDTDEDYEKLRELAATVIDFWAENGLEHERCGEMIERIGLANFLEGIGVEVDPNMISHPRTSSYVRLDDWDQEAQKWIDRKKQAAA